MKDTIGNNIRLTVFGESHGDAIGFTLDGIAPGIQLDLDLINKQLDLRKPKGKISTPRKESDEPKFISGYFNGYTTGNALTVIFENSNTHSKDYSKTKNLMRPSHADYTGYMRYNGFNDYRGGGHFSGRLTTCIVCAGAIAKQILEKKGIYIGSHITSIQNIKDDPFDTINEDVLKQQILSVNDKYFPALNDETGNRMISFIEEAANNGDSVGGIIESGVIGLEVGIGEPMFDSLESVLSHYIFSVPAVKGVEFGLGFGLQDLYGSEANDPFYYDHTNVKTKTNNSGGINGGISNGMPIIIKSVVKPTASIFKEQDTINIETKQNEKLIIQGRHDPAIVHRARVVIDSVIALGILDTILEKYGYSWMNE